MIVPTIGRVVLVQGRHANPKSSQAEPALVCFVHSDRSINVGGFNAHGMPFAMTTLPLRQPEDPVPAGGAYAEWMPWQIENARVPSPQPASVPDTALGEAAAAAKIV